MAISTTSASPAASQPSQKSHIKTPLLLSATLSQLANANVFTKVESLQPAGSFKIRGLGHSVQVARAQYGDKLHVVSSSGGNAGLAACTASRVAGVKATLYCPAGTEDHIVKLVEAEGATVIRGGKNFDEAHAAALEHVRKDPNAVLMHPFEGEHVVAGNSTIVDEIYDQLRDEHGVPAGPDMISTAVGGGGLLNGILTGLQRQFDAQPHLEPPEILGVQCFGADSFSQSMAAGKPVTLDTITSKCTSLGARTCSASTVQRALAYPKGKLHTAVMDDAVAASASWKFARDHRILAEISCGAALAPIYCAERFMKAGVFEQEGERKKNIVVVVCGGSKDSLETIQGYQKAEEARGGVGMCRVMVDGKDV